jgi:hypothetical protein
MRKGWLMLLVVAVTGLVFLAIGPLASIKAADAPAELVIENKVYKEDKKGPVKFGHQKHSTDYKITCKQCHHVYKDGANVWKEGDPVQKCSACHNPEKKEGKVDKLQNAFHKNCRNCHKEQNKGPFKKCTECHA